MIYSPLFALGITLFFILRLTLTLLLGSCVNHCSYDFYLASELDFSLGAILGDSGCDSAPTELTDAIVCGFLLPACDDALLGYFRVNRGLYVTGHRRVLILLSTFIKAIASQKDESLKTN